MALNIILPDFKENDDLEYLVYDLKQAAVEDFYSTPEKELLARKIYTEVARKNDIPSDISQYVLEDVSVVVALATIEAFNIIPFHGQRLTDAELLDWPSTDGPPERYRMLARAPYYTVQFLNVLNGVHLYANLNKETMYRRNNQLIENTDMGVFDAHILELRNEQ